MRTSSDGAGNDGETQVRRAPVSAATANIPAGVGNARKSWIRRTAESN